MTNKEIFIKEIEKKIHRTYQEEPPFHEHGRNPGESRERENKGGETPKNRLIIPGIRATLKTRIFFKPLSWRNQNETQTKRKTKRIYKQNN